MWNVVNVKREENRWELDLIGREKEMIASAEIQKMTLVELERVVGAAYFNAGEECGITVVNSNEVYVTYIQLADVSKEHTEKKTKNYEGLEATDQYKMVMKEAKEYRAKYDKWKGQPQRPLEECMTSEEPAEYYFGLRKIVYIHIVGQLSVNI